MSRLFVLYLVSLLTLLGCASVPPKDSCVENRVAFDIGSGTTKAILAKVDFCQGRLIETLWKPSAPVAYQESLKGGPEFDAKVREDGRTKFISLLKESMNRGADRAGGVATHAFRQASNGESFLAELQALSSRHLPTRLTVITQDQELRLGYLAGLLASGTVASGVVVWDIGGGSQQMAAQQGPEILTYKGEMASTAFMQSFPLKRAEGKRETPNPIGKKSFRQGLLRARKEARKVPLALRSLLRKGEVLGVGGVLSKSVQGQLGRSTFTADDLEAVVMKKLDLSDAEIGGDYANTQVSNLILVLGFMRELGIQRMTAVDANLGTSVLVSPEFWP